ncbi:MAG: helix-turn-helix domain-containing protein [Candidatus Phlomobacter fragariae]
MKHLYFADRLNQLMKDKDITIKELSQISGVTYEMARRYTLGSAKPRDEKMIKIANLLGVSAAWLDYGIENEVTKILGMPKPKKLTLEQAEMLRIFSSFPEKERKEWLEIMKKQKMEADEFIKRWTKEQINKD